MQMNPITTQRLDPTQEANFQLEKSRHLRRFSERLKKVRLLDSFLPPNHPNHIDFPCPTCSVGFTNAETLKRHQSFYCKEIVGSSQQQQQQQPQPKKTSTFDETVGLFAQITNPLMMSLIQTTATSTSTTSQLGSLDALLSRNSLGCNLQHPRSPKTFPNTIFQFQKPHTHYGT